MPEDPTRNTVTVRIAGEDHVLRSTAPEAHTRKCAEFLDEQVREIRELSTFTETHRAVILAALAITDRFLRTREELDRLRREVTSRSMNLVRRVEDELDPPDPPS